MQLLQVWRLPSSEIFIKKEKSSRLPTAPPRRIAVVPDLEAADAACCRQFAEARQLVPVEVRAEGAGDSRLPVRLDVVAGSSDSLAGWLEAYFAVEVTTAQSSRAVQRRDLTRFLRFMEAEEGNCERDRWTSRLSWAFLDALRNEVAEDTFWKAIWRVRGALS